MKDIQLMVPLMKVDGRAHKRVAIKPRHRTLFVELQKPEHEGQIGKAMAAIGYTPSMIHNPREVTTTKSWQALLEEHMPQSLLAKRHEELLNKRDTSLVTIGRGKKARVELIDRGPDTSAVKGALEMAYKLRGSFVAEPPAAPVANIYNLFYQPTVRAQVTAFEDQLKAAIAHEINPELAAPRIITQEGTDTSDTSDAGRTA